MARKAKKTRRTFTDTFKRKVVAQVKEGRAKGTGTLKSVAAKLKLSPSVINRWMKAPALRKATPTKRSKRATRTPKALVATTQYACPHCGGPIVPN